MRPIYFLLRSAVVVALLQVVLWLSCSASLLAQGGTRFSLDEAVSYAIQHAADVKAAQLDIADANWQVIEFRSIGMPQVNAGVQYQYFIQLPAQVALRGSFSPGDATLGIPPFPAEDTKIRFGTNHNLSGNVSYNQLIFDGSYIVGLRAAKELKNLTQRQARIPEYQVRFQVASAYVLVLVAQENYTLLQKNIGNLERTLNEVRQLQINGFVEQLDVDRLSLSLRNLRTEAEALAKQIEVAKMLLRFQMTYPPDQPIELTDNIEGLLAQGTPNLDGEINLAARPEYEVLKGSMGLNELNVLRLKRSYLPSVAAFAQHQQTLQRNNLFTDAIGPIPMTVAGLSISIPIYDGMRRKSQIERAGIARDKLSLQVEQFERAVRLQVNTARQQYRIAQERVAARREGLQLAESIYQTTQVKYREGVGSSVELTQAERELYAAQSAYLNALYDQLVAKLDIQKAMGR